MRTCNSWRKSSFSGDGDYTNCVEARSTGPDFQVRDSKLGHDSPVFDLTSGDFTALLSAPRH